MDGRLLDPTSPYYYKIFLRGIKSTLIEKGTSFSRHYCTSPQCVPSRTSLMTGRYVSDTGTTNNGQGIAASTKTGKLDSACVSNWNASQCAAFAAAQKVNATILDLLASAGYDLQLFGRVDAGAGILDDYAGTTGDGFHGGPSLPILSRGANIHGITKEEPYSASTESDPAPYATDVAHAASVVDFLEHHDPASAKPFFLWLGFISPHPPYDTSAAYVAHVNASAVDAPILPDRATMHPFDVYASVTKHCFQLDYTPDQLKEMRTAYWGAAAESMSLFESVLAAANATGHLNNTVVILTADHGENSMENRMDYKNSMREPSLRVPLIVTPFGVPALSSGVGRVVVNVTSHIDILPTLLDLAGASIPGYARGQSLVPFLRAGTPPPRSDHVVAEYHSNMGNTGSFGIVRGDWKLITFGHTLPWFNATAYVPMLYNTRDDPLETTNVAAANPALVASLTALLEGPTGLGRSLQQIDAEQMASNLQLFRDWYVQRLTKDELLDRFTTAYTNVSVSEVKALVSAWAGVVW